MNLRTQPVRVAGAVAAVLAAGTTTFLALATGSASADEPGRCTQNVNVREEPNENAKIVALCETGTQVMLGAERDGWVKLDALGGWASKDFVKPDETAAERAASGDHASGSQASDDANDDRAGDDNTSDRPSGDERSGDHESDDHAGGSAGHESGSGSGSGGDSAGDSREGDSQHEAAQDTARPARPHSSGPIGGLFR